MNRWKPTPQVLMLVVVFALGAALSPSLSGCLLEQTSLGRVIYALGGDSYPLSEEGSRELERFRAVYLEYAADEAGGGSEAETGRFEHFQDAYRRIRRDYVREVSDATLIDAAVEGVRGLEKPPHSVERTLLVETALDTMLASLDPHSSYLNPDEYREMQVSTRGEFGGLGIEVTMEDGLVKVIAPIDDTPAFRAGIEAGDLITHLDGDSIKGITLMDAVRRMRGRPGTKIRLTVARAARDPFDVTVTRDIIRIRAVRWRTEGDIGYLRVVAFNEKVEEGVEQAMANIHSRLGQRMKGLVLDLRNNPGGLFIPSLALSDAFLDRGTIVSVRGRDPDNARFYDAETGDLAEGLPMVVLINGGSASASEIVASALQDHGRAIVMGGRSFGKGSVQIISPLPIEGALRLTTQLYYAPSGRTIQARGVQPDIVLRPAEATEIRREADYPDALPGEKSDTSRAHATLPVEDCPAAGEGENEDLALGCALALLRAGSTESFLASLAGRQPM